MARPPREFLRPIKNSGIAAQRFKRLIQPSRQVGAVIHAFVVIADLRRGSLSSLEKYLSKNKGIPDREVAMERRKLISGTKERSRYRLVVVEHPDKPKDLGGRPSTDDKTNPSDRDQKISSRYQEILAREGKAYLAIELAAKEFGLSVATIRRAIKRWPRRSRTCTTEKNGGGATNRVSRAN